MRILVDTNIILDVLCNRKPYAEESAKILKLCEVKKIDGYISALSVPNIIYIMRKEIDEAKIEEILNTLNLIFTIADLKAGDLQAAVRLGFKDYEDALQSVCASRLKANYIITRNVKDFNPSRTMAIEPKELLEQL